jgi:hypothetical protein
MSRRWAHGLAIGFAVFAGLLVVAVSVVVPVVLLVRLDDQALDRWAQIGQALEPVAVFFSGVAFVGIVLTLFLQGRELQNQREELTLIRDEQQRGGEIAIRQLHTDLIKMAIADHELRQVLPPLAAGIAETKKDHYCNLILNLQKIAYEAHTIELPELRAALTHLMGSPDMYRFWRKARAVRETVTAGDVAEDFFTGEVDRAFLAVAQPKPRTLSAVLAGAIAEWQADRRSPRRR